MIKDIIDLRGGYCLNIPSELMKDNELLKAENCWWNNGITKRGGISTYSTTNLTAMVGFKGSIRCYINSTWYTIIAIDDNTNIRFYAGTTTTFAQIDASFTFTRGANVEMAELLGHVVMVNGVDKPAVIYWDSALVVENLEAYDTRTRSIVNWYAGQWRNDLSGYQENGLTGKTGATATGLSTTTQYYFTLTIDGGTETEYDITTEADVTYDAVIILLNAEISGAVFSLYNGDLRCTSASTGAASAIALAVGTTGTDLFDTLTDWTAFETAVAGIASNFIDDTTDAQDAGTADFQLANLEDDCGFYISCDFTFNKVVFSTAGQATGSPVAEYMYWNGTAWTTVGTLVTTPAWTAAAADRTLEFNLPLDSDGLILWQPYGDDTTTGLVAKYVIRVRFTTNPSAIFSCAYLALYNTQYLTQIMQNEKPHLVRAHNSQIYMASYNIVNFSPPYYVTGWREGQSEHFDIGGAKIMDMVSFADTLVIGKENTLYTWSTSNLMDPIRSRPLTTVGPIASRSMVQIGNYVTFVARDGVYLWDGNNITKLSKHIKTDFDAWTKTTASAVVYDNHCLISFPTDSIVLVFDPDTFRLDDMGDGRVSFYKWTGYKATQLLNCNGAGDTGYLLATVDQDDPYVARCDYGTQDNILAAVNIAMECQTKYFSDGNFQVLKGLGRLKVKVKEVSAHSGARHRVTMYADDGVRYEHAFMLAPKGTGYYTEDIRVPYIIDGTLYGFGLRHNGPTGATLTGFSIETFERSY